MGDHDKLIYKLIKEIPSTASVTAQYQIAPHIVRPPGKIKAIPQTNEQSDYVLADINLPLVLVSSKDYFNYLNGLLKNKQYQLIFAKEGLLLFKKQNNVDKNSTLK